MPVYLRKNAGNIPSSPGDFAADDDADFITDPDQFRDQLPQPFRMINKLIKVIIDDAWEITSSRETDRVAEASKIRPPQYECGIRIEAHGKTCGMAASADGRYMMLGQVDGLVVLNAESQETVSQWKEDNMQLVELGVVTMAEDIYLITTIDDMGIARLFSLASEQLFLLANLNEQEGGGKVIASKCQSSSQGEYAGVCLQNVSDKQNWLEVHKLPVDVWLKELESQAAKAPKKETTNGAPAASKERPTGSAKSTTEQTEDVPIEYAHPSEGQITQEDEVDKHSQAEPAEGEEQPVDDNVESASHVDQEGTGSKPSYKFTATSLVVRVRPPQDVSGISWNSPIQLAKTVDATGDVIGTGASHMISTQHLEQRKAIFENFHLQHLKYLPKDSQQLLCEPTFHFAQPGRLLPHGMEQSALIGQPTTVAVWWAGHHQVNHYSLVKPAKDVERKPDLVWPLSSAIVASTVSPCTSLLALALQNNNIVVWDLYMGAARSVVHVTDEGRISKLSFLDASICTQDTSNYPPYTTSTNCQLMVTCNDGQVFLINCGMNNQTPLEDIILGIEKQDELPTLIELINGIPELLVTCRQNGRLYIQDLLQSGKILCEVTLPAAYELSQPWQPILAVGAMGQMLYLKGSLREKPACNEEAVDENENSVEGADCLFVFQLRSFPTLDRFRTVQRQAIPYKVHATANHRVDALLQERLSQQGLRKSRMQGRWSQLKAELEVIKQMREPSKGKEKTRSAFT